MVVIRVGEDYADGHFSLLRRHLDLLDIELTSINAAIQNSADPDSDGLLDFGEYFIGHGFVAIQRYFTSTYACLSVAQSVALGLPPVVNSNVTFAEAINAGANYWKHVEEWFGSVNKDENASLKGYALKTLTKLEMVTAWADYTCANLLASLGDGKALGLLSPLLPQVAEWRSNLLEKSRLGMAWDRLETSKFKDL